MKISHTVVTSDRIAEKLTNRFPINGINRAVPPSVTFGFCSLSPATSPRTVACVQRGVAGYLRSCRNVAQQSLCRFVAAA